VVVKVVSFMLFVYLLSQRDLHQLDPTPLDNTKAPNRDTIYFTKACSSVFNTHRTVV
jgi:hypothetical protein